MQNSDSKFWRLILQFQPFFRYALVGSLGTLIDLGTFYWLRQFVGLNLIVSTVFAFLLAVINNFILNKYWTFQNAHRNFRKQFVKFLIVSLIGLGLTVSLMYCLVELMHFGDLKIMFGIPRFGELMAKALTSLIVLSWNFLGNKLWTFRDKKWVDYSEETYLYDLSVVIPAYNEARRISDTLKEVFNFLNNREGNYEVIVVDDGSSDDTIKVVRSLSPLFANLRVIPLIRNCGKGAAVKEGTLQAQGKYVLFMDADNSTHIEEIDKMLPCLENDNADLVIGSRYLDRASVKIRQPWYRVLIGRVGNLLIRFMLVDDICDTQCGFKLFPLDVAKNLFQRIKIKRFGFDMELLAIAQNVLGYEIKELPVDWYDSADTRVRPIKAAVRTFWELLLIKFNLLSGRYR